MKHSAKLFIAAAALAAAAPMTVLADDVSDGKALFTSATCAACHDAESNTQKVGPGLAGIKDGKLPSGKDATDANIMAVINDGEGAMPAFGERLNDDEKAKLLTYLKTL